MATQPQPKPGMSPEDLMQWFADSFGVDLRDMPPQEAVGMLMDLGRLSQVMPWEEPREPLELAPPPAQSLRYTLKVTLDGSKPPIWRRITVPSEVTLDQFHHVLQAAMGWTNSHLHQFTPGHDRLGQRTEKIVTPFDVSEGDAGREESTIRLDALVTKPGDKLHYWYDFGDSWHHTVLLEKTEPRAADDDRAACLAGRRACPPEDIGGIHFYSTIFDSAEDPDAPEYEWAREIVANLRLTREEAAAFDLEAHDLAVRRAMAGGRALRRMIGDPGAYPVAIRELFSGLGHEAAEYVAGYVDAARVEDPVRVEPDEAREATAVVRAFLDHVGDGGLEMTAAGYLKPASVSALMAELDPDRAWIGSATVERHTGPLLNAREIITGMGLLRKTRGRLVLTKAGARLRKDPVGLWWHIARRLPVERPDEGRDAAVFLLLHLAAGRDEGSMGDELEMFMAVRGWHLPDEGLARWGDPWRSFARRTEEVLRWAASGRVYDFPVAPLGSPASRQLARGALAVTRDGD
ncbi:plasmid pRiA4b ORF-3 family protein [Tessaracoccus oleiagri]|uniref:PRiA4b ORF-3-like protein n=1 Tax=Tessaracoccus oleiagri TaxID=686624 RepID=A0A1G9HZ78_9ACTN|nr:plasmid pRiA4b ORF-3 family protein [Tessaracoccus oleiagri]SDL18278.1 pRiA4b ORF-3-like protein [Tessaracoccus oleiagri]